MNTTADPRRFPRGAGSCAEIRARGGVGAHPEGLQMGPPGPWQVATGLNVATEGQEQPVATATINCSDRLGCRASAGVRCPTGSTGFAPRGAGLEGKERRVELKHLWWMKGIVQVGLLKAAGM